MIAQEKVKRWRVDHGLTIAQMARQLRISETLLYIVEDGGVTHPRVAERFQKLCGLTDLEAEGLIPVHLRPHGGDYDPERYLAPADIAERAQKRKEC